MRSGDHVMVMIGYFDKGGKLGTIASDDVDVDVHDGHVSFYVSPGEDGSQEWLVPLDYLMHLPPSKYINTPMKRFLWRAYEGYLTDLFRRDS